MPGARPCPHGTGASTPPPSYIAVSGCLVICVSGTLDRYGYVYGSYGVPIDLGSITVAAHPSFQTGIGGSVMGGWMIGNPYPCETELNNFIAGPTANLGFGAYYAAGNVEWNVPSNSMGVEAGIGSPGWSFGVSNSHQIPEPPFWGTPPWRWPVRW
jgi:hypothetical protein